MELRGCTCYIVWVLVVYLMLKQGGCMEKIVLYTHPQSRGRNVVWMLEECGAEYETVLMNFGEDLHSPAYLAVNPMGKLPALKYGDTVITEASAIITFLADLFPQAQLAPAQVDGQRGEYYRWLFYTANSVEAALMEVAFQFPIQPAMRKSLGYGSMEQVIATLDVQLSKQSYLLGEHFQSCDLLLAGLLMFAIRTGTLSPTPNMQAYLGRITERTAYQKMLQIGEKQMAQLSA